MQTKLTLVAIFKPCYTIYLVVLNGEENMTAFEEKQILRKKIKLSESSLSAEFIEKSSIEICKRLENFSEYNSAKNIFCFVGIRNEPNTLPFLNSVLRSGKQLCVPLCTEKGIMELRKINSLSELCPGAYGIPEPPVSSEIIAPSLVDFAVIPCLSCDKFGNRLGKGGGYYDRFLANYNNFSVMLCFSSLLQKKIPTEPHDCKISTVLTENGYYFNGTFHK